jgi:hypothetical protein
MLVLLQTGVHRNAQYEGIPGTLVELFRFCNFGFIAAMNSRP